MHLEQALFRVSLAVPRQDRTDLPPSNRTPKEKTPLLTSVSKTTRHVTKASYSSSSHPAVGAPYSISTSTVVPSASFPWRIISINRRLNASIFASASRSAALFLAASSFASVVSRGLSRMPSAAGLARAGDAEADALLTVRLWPWLAFSGAGEAQRDAHRCLLDGRDADVVAVPGMANGLGADAPVATGMRLGEEGWRWGDRGAA